MNYIFACLLPYTMAAIFMSGVCLRLAEWVRTPVPFHLTLFPVPKNLPGKVRVFAVEFFFCPALFRQDKKLWFLTLLFHISLAMAIIGHFLGIYFLREQFALIGFKLEASRLISQYSGGATGLVMTASLMGLIYRRITVKYIKKLSEPDNYFSLFLILAIAISGMLMYLPGFKVDLPSVRSFASGLFTPGSVSVPENKPFIVHFVLVGVLLIYFPFSRMFHAAGFFVIRAMLVETPPEYPTQQGLRQRSAFALKKVYPDIPVSRKQAGKLGG